MRMTTATTQSTESDAQVASAACHGTAGSSISTRTTPAATTNPAATARFQWSKATVAKEATITTPTAATVNSYPARAWAPSSTTAAMRLTSGDHQRSGEGEPAQDGEDDERGAVVAVPGRDAAAREQLDEPAGGEDEREDDAGRQRVEESRAPGRRGNSARRRGEDVCWPFHARSIVHACAGLPLARRPHAAA